MAALRTLYASTAFTLCLSGASFAQQSRCRPTSADDVVIQVQQAPAFRTVLLLAARHYVGRDTLPTDWLYHICVGMVRSVPRFVAGLTMVRAQLGEDIEALRATFAVSSDGVALLNHVTADTVLDVEIDLSVWNRTVARAMPQRPPAQDVSAALEYACLFQALNFNHAPMDLSGGQCWGPTVAVNRRGGTRGVTVLTDELELTISESWELERIRRR